MLWKFHPTPLLFYLGCFFSKCGRCWLCIPIWINIEDEEKNCYNQTKKTTTKSSPYEVLEYFFVPQESIVLIVKQMQDAERDRQENEKGMLKKRKICFRELNGNNQNFSNRKRFFSCCETNAIKIELMQAQAVQ